MGSTDLDRVFAGEIPELYDRYLVPFIFAEYAEDLAARVAQRAPSRVLELAAGTGVLSSALASRNADAAIVATDLNQAMIDYAASQRAASNIEWRQADAMSLPFEDGSFDAMACQFGVMFFPDRVHAYREARRVLISGGSFVFSTWDRIEESEIPMAVSDSVGAMFPDDPPSFLRRTPHGYHDVAAVRADLEAAGFEEITIETVAHRSVAASPREPALALCAGTPLRNEVEARDASRLDEAVEVAARAVAARFGDGRVEGKIQAHLIIAR